VTDAEHYTYRVQWSQEDEQFLGTVAEFPSLSWAADSSSEAFSGIRSVVVEVLADMAGTGEVPPVAFGDRTYSGRFLVRMPPGLHRQLVIEAAEQQVSLNSLALTRLVGT
jgi:predicted HicB family RNase H-like nuclease